MKRILVDCEFYDPILKNGGPRIFGGPQMRGFDFFVKDEEVDEMIEYIKECLKTYRRPLVDIRTQDANPEIQAWDKEHIEQCIKVWY